MADEGGNQEDLSFQAPEDDDMDFDTSLPVETMDDLKPQTFAGSSEPKPTALASDEDIRKLRTLFDVPLEIEIGAKKTSNLRLNTIHVRGVQELGSDEVLKYFDSYDPASLEWVNDLTCNVVFDDPRAAATAMIGLMAGFVNAKKDGDGPSESKDLTGVTVIDPNALEVPVPPDNWILGKAHPKSKALLLRIATVNDKKIQGAGKYSEFYRKHGNPHYGGRKNLISKSLSEKLSRHPDALEHGLIEDDLIFDTNEELVSPAPRKLRMKMRADDEEEAKAQNILVSIPNNDSMDRVFLDEELDEDIDREVIIEPRKKSIWDRLGPKSSESRDREWGLSTRSRGIDRTGHYSRERSSVFNRLSFGPSEGRDRPSFKPSKSRSIIYSNLRIKK